MFTLFSVNEVAKRTGDFRSLSATDIRVIALTYEMHEQYKDMKLPQVSYLQLVLRQFEVVCHYVFLALYFLFLNIHIQIHVYLEVRIVKLSSICVSI